MADLDVLMITYDRADYTSQSLAHLLETADPSTRIWIWHNGQDERTLEVVQAFLDHPKVGRFHHSVENVGLREPTNWLWAESRATFLAKVDDDCLVEPGWSQPLIAAHNSFAGFGVLGCWRYQDEDLIPMSAAAKTTAYPGGHQVLRNLWVQGSSYVMPRQRVEECGLLRSEESFTQYCKRLAVGGYVNGWYYPLIHEDHMDDPRSPNTGLRTDADLMQRLPLSAKKNGVASLAEWEAQIRRSARIAQEAPLDPRRYVGWRRRVRNLSRRAKRVATRRHW